MNRVGFFTRTDIKEATRRPVRAKRGEASEETLQRLGPAGVRNMNRKAEHPDMKPSGPTKPLLYVLGEAPGAQEDHEGKPFVGASGQKLRAAIPGWVRSQTRFDNVVRTRPPGNRDPKPQEIECFRAKVELSIAQAEPRVILGVGAIALRWATGLTALKAARGKAFPVEIAGHSCWFVPVMHPAWLIRIADQRQDKVPGSEWISSWQQDIDRAAELAEGVTVPSVCTEDEIRAGVAHCRRLSEVEDALDYLKSVQVVGWDWETQRLRPYHKRARVLSVALSDGEKTFSWPIDHDEAGWSRAERRRLLKTMRSFWINGPKKIAHNLPFEMEWAIHLLGDEVAFGLYGCSMSAAFVLDPGPPGTGAGGHSLEFLSVLYYGLSLKGLTFAGSWRDRLHEMPISKLLDYNALDAKVCRNLWCDELMPRVEREGLEYSYRLQMERVCAIVFAQRDGVPTDVSETRRLQKLFSDEEKLEVKRLKARREVKRYRKVYGKKFNWTSNDDIGRLLGGVLGLLSEKTKTGKYKTSKDILDQVESDAPAVEQLLRLRSLGKLRGTYVDRFDPDHEESYICEDGLVHCNFTITGPRTARLASYDPNSQNWPIRQHKEVRRQIMAPKGWSFVSADLGQIEARVLACESCDSVWIGMIHDDYDVHLEWAQKIVEIEPDFLARHDGNMKAARSTAKNGWVFPAFYGSSIRSITKNLSLPERPANDLFDEFWDTFAGIRAWQRRKWNNYQEDGCVWSLTGRRRLAPLSWNMVINSPIQTTASDICVDAMVRLCQRAVDEERPWLQPRLQIHDDLKFLMPDSELDEGIVTVVEEQLGFEAPWLNVPLSVDVEVGPNLFEMEPVGTWRSDQI